MLSSIIYYSQTGHTKIVGEYIEEGMKNVGMDVKTMSIDSLNLDNIKDSTCIIFGSPVYVAGLALPMTTFLQREARTFGLKDKLGGAFVTADYLHGGISIALQEIIRHELVFGMLPYSGGAANGRPFIHLGPAALAKDLEEQKENFIIYGQRMGKKAFELFSK
ncbi:MAG: flavodoxin domain-containing protein [Tissierellia bacterium]|nr:flavodoxin domain-containing protein [Tissierellia bacterium]